MTLRKKTSHLIVAAVAASTFGIIADSSFAHAALATPGLEESGTIVGHDDEGNPIYSTTGSGISDPGEWFEDLEIPKAAATVDEVTEYPDGVAPICQSKRTITTTNIPNALTVDWADSVINNTTRTAKYTVKAETSKTFSWSVSGTVSAEFKALIFSNVSVTINSGIAGSKTTTYGSQIEVEVPAKKTVKADRGMWQEKFNYSYYKITERCVVTRGSGTGKAPYRQAWHLY